MVKLAEDERLFRKIEDKIKRTIFDYDLVNDGDRILVGLSGGKDSLALVDLLGRRLKIHCPQFEVVVVRIVMTNVPYCSDREYLKSCAEEHNLPSIVHKTSLNPFTSTRESPCFLCSWTRRKALLEIAKAHKCNKVTLGHHQDDILETLLMSLTHQGAFETMPPRLKTDKFDMEIIRPMCLVEKRKLIQVVAWKRYQKRLRSCLCKSGSSCSDMKELLRSLEAANPETRYSLWGNMTDMQEDYSPRKIGQYAKCLYNFIVDRV